MSADKAGSTEMVILLDPYWSQTTFALGPSLIEWMDGP